MPQPGIHPGTLLRLSVSTLIGKNCSNFHYNHGSGLDSAKPEPCSGIEFLCDIVLRNIMHAHGIKGK